MSFFAEVTKQVRQINDIILLNMKNGKNDESIEALEIKRHLGVTKDWFMRISWTNKKKFLLLLMEDVQCIWTFSLLLKSIWNCRPKDAVMSVCEQRVWSSYDQVPLDNDRTALPPSILAKVMMIDRIWFKTLEAEEQALVLTELVTMSGGPIMWEVLNQAQQIYEKHIEQQLENLEECEVIYEPLPEKKAAPEPVKKDQTPRRKSSFTQGTDSAKSGPGQAQKELDTNLTLWAATVKSIKDYMKLEELEMTFKDGTKKKLWKVNRPKQEAVETVDMIQLLPSSISKRIFMYIPPQQFGDCARVNKYWAFLVEEIKAELTARQKIDIELAKLHDIVVRHDFNLDLMSKSELQTSPDGSSSKQTTKTYIQERKKPLSHYFLKRRRERRPQGEFKPIRNMADCTERLEVRGAADDTIWKWCSNVLKINKETVHSNVNENNQGLLIFGHNSFPCPLMCKKISTPVNPPVATTYKVHVKTDANMSPFGNGELTDTEVRQRFSLWSRDFSRLYPVYKISSQIVIAHKNK